MGAFGAADGITHGEESEGAFDADALGRHFDFVILVIGGSRVVSESGFSGTAICGRGDGLGFGRLGVGEPGGGMGHWAGIVFGIAGVVDDFLEANVVVVEGVPSEWSVVRVFKQEVLDGKGQGGCIDNVLVP